MNEKVMLDISGTLVPKPLLKALVECIGHMDHAELLRHIACLQQMPVEALTIPGFLGALDGLKKQFGRNIVVVTKCDNEDEVLAKLVFLEIIGFWEHLDLTFSDTTFVVVQSRRAKARWAQANDVTLAIDDHGGFQRAAKKLCAGLRRIWINGNEYRDLYPDVAADAAVLKAENWHQALPLLSAA